MQAGVDAFVLFDNKFLLIQRDDIAGIQNPDMWNLPGGGIEENENEQQSLIRELKEEIGVKPQNIVQLDKTSYPDGNVVTKFWVVLTPDELKSLKLGEGQKMEFFTFDQFFNLNIIPNLRTYINLNREQLLEHLLSQKF